jgi:autotransporter-associated beta strand protein
MHVVINSYMRFDLAGRVLPKPPIRFHGLIIAAVLAGWLCQVRGADNLQHPILSISSNNGSSANTVINNYTESQYTNFFTPRYGPRNEGYGFGAAVVSGDSGWSWSISNPTNITSTPSGTVLPANTGYPVHTQAVTTFTGDTVQAPYYNAASSGKSFVFNVISYHQQGQRDTDFGNLSGAYVNTGLSQSSRENYARRIAIELLDWGRWYPDYTLTGKNSASYINTSPSYILSADAQRASDHNGLAHEWNDTPLKAFDAIYDSDVLTNMNAEMGFDVRDFITSNIFFCEGDFFINHVPISVAIDSNLSGPYDTLPEVARVLNRPDYIVWMDQYLTALITDNVNRDGQLLEGLGYSMNYLNANVTAAQNTQAYFFTRPATNSQFLGISNRAVVYAGSLEYGQQEMGTIALPNGELPSFGDTQFGAYFSARNAGNSSALGGYGHVSMGAGTSSGTAVQVNQQFAGNDNHMRSDTTAFTLWAFGNPYLENIRYYNGAIGRNWGEQMLEKDSVVINRTDLTPFPICETYGNANLNLCEPGNNGLAMTEIDGYRDYSGEASRYQRLLFLNSVDLTKPYVVDVFRVTGGTNHDYTFHGAIRWTQTGSCSFPLVTNNNPYPMLEPGDPAWSLSTDTPYYGFFRGISSNTVPGNFYLTYTDTNRSTAHDTRMWMTTDPTTYNNSYNFYLGWTPVPARDNTVPTNFFNYLNLTRPSAIVRHRISSGTLSDLFVSVFEPFNAGTSNIVSVTRLPMNNSLESCALQITFKDGRVDTYVVNLDNPKVAGANIGSSTVSTTDGQYVLNGRAGLIVDRSNGDPRVWTMNATDFKFPGRELSTPTNTYYSGWISGATRQFDGAAYNALTTTTPLPTGTALRGRPLSLTFGTLSGSGTQNISQMFSIDQVVLSNGLYYICFASDHFLEITNGTTTVEQVAPLRTFTTSNSFEIALTAFAGQISPIADQNLSPGSSSGPIPFSFGNLGTTSGSSLQVLATSANQALVPNSNLALSGSGTNRTLVVTTAPGLTGTAPITVSTTDGTWTNSRTFNVIVGNFALTVSPASQSVTAGAAVNFTNVVTATNGAGTVTFNVSGLPTGAGAEFNPTTTSGAGTNVLTITTTSNSTPSGSYPLTIVATSPTQSATNVVTLIVNVISPVPGWDTWTGGSGAGNNWSDYANWSSPLQPSNSLAFGGIARLNNTNDTAAATFYSNIVFNPGAGAFALNGNPVTLVTGVTNNSSVPQTVGVGLNFGNSIALNGAAAPLIIAGGLTNTIGATSPTHLTLEGSGAISNSLANTISPGGTNYVILDNPAANWTVTGNNSSAVPWVLYVTNGTFNFGDAGDAPTLTTTTAHNSPSDNQFAMVSGANAAFNMINGTLTLNAPLNTCTVANSTNTLNQVGGTLNLAGSPYYFQGANGGNAGELSIVNVSGGVMNIGSAANPTNFFYLASRGSGILTVSGSGVLSCGRLDVSRNASGNTISSSGTVNLNGGTLSVTSVTNASANQQTGGTPAAIFNFNGGTLVAKPGASQNFFQGSTVPPVIPIQTFVKIGGATIDDGGQSVTFAEPLQHDATLGANPDGGLAKLDTGTLTLTGTNTYTGNTSVKSGTLALAVNGSISNSAEISLTNSTIDASKRTDGTLTLAAAQTLAGNGAIVGNTILNGAFSPGDTAVGALTNTGSITFGAGGRYIFDMEDAAGQSGTNWDFISAGGGFSVQSSAGNPFLVQLRSIDDNPSDNNPGAANFGNASSQSWPIAATAAAITNFAGNKFTVDDTAFLNDLAGGYFIVSTNANSLLLTFVPNHPPSANDAFFYLPPAGALQIPVSSLAAKWTDPDGDPVQFLGVSSNSANGDSVSTDGTLVYYTGIPNVADTITYTVGDVRTNPPAVYRPGDTQLTAAGLIHVLPPPAIRNLTFTGGKLIFGGGGGIAGGNYAVLTSTNVAMPLNQWTSIATNSFDINGDFSFTNSPDPSLQQAYYLLRLQ